MSKFSLYGQTKYTHEFNYIAETLLEMYDEEELLNGMFPLKFRTTKHYHHKYLDIQTKLLCTKYTNGSFR